MKPQNFTLTRDKAVELNRDLMKVRKKVRYLKSIDCEMIYRLGGKDDPKISKVRTKEDSRPLTRKDRITGDLVEKANDIITYSKDDELYVLAMSGGVSLFDGKSPKLKMNKNDRWYVIPRNTPVPEGVVIAKDIQVDRYGLYHYGLQPEYDMTLVEFQKKLDALKKFMRLI